MHKKHIQPDEKVALKTAPERTLLLEGLTLLPTEHEEAIHRQDHGWQDGEVGCVHLG
jgi:hypothetical protein